jgi:hypothetical protein
VIPSSGNSTSLQYVSGVILRNRLQIGQRDGKDRWSRPKLSHFRPCPTCLLGDQGCHKRTTDPTLAVSHSTAGQGFDGVERVGTHLYRLADLRPGDFLTATNDRFRAGQFIQAWPSGE